MAPPDKGDLLAGRYRIVELLGQGGMGSVYLADDRETGEQVAVKLLRKGSDADPSLYRRFEREIQTLQKLEHPSILRYIDHGREGGTIFLVVELLRGRSLADAAGDFSGQIDRILILGTRLARGFAAAHAIGIVHRDIKPGNIHITTSGEPRILDYGLARWEQPDGPGAESMTTMERLTQTNAIVGTIPYMSPEQLRAEPVDRRTDIYSLAVMLYELAAGRRPFERGTMIDLLRAMEAGDPPVLPQAAPGAGGPSGAALDAILRRALHPLPHHRIQSMDELAEALDKARDLASAIPRDASIAILLAPSTTAASGLHAGFVGREPELARLGELLTAARAGRGSGVLVEGPAGIGRSALVHRFGRDAHRDGALVLMAAVPPAEAGLAEGAMVAWLSRASDVFPNDPELARARALYEASGAADPALARSRQDRAIAALAALATRMPLVLIAEDLHHSSAEFLDSVVQLAMAAAGLPMLLVVTARSDATPSEAAERGLDRLGATQGVAKLALEPLGQAALAEIVGEIYAGLELEGPLLAQLAEQSAGNPSYARSILGLLEQRGLLRRSGSEWSFASEVTALPAPPAAEEILRERLEDLPDEHRALLEAAAVLGEQFEAELLARLMDESLDAIDARLRLLARRRLILREARACRFDRSTTHDGILRQLEPDRMRRLHARAAGLLAEDLEVGHGEGARVSAAVAAHWIAAAEPSQALPYALRAATLLARHNANEDAIPWLEKCRAILEPSLESAEESAREPMRAQLLEIDLALGECLHAVDRYDEALASLERGRALAASLGRSDLQARCLTWMSRSYVTRGDLLAAEKAARDAERAARRGSHDLERALALDAGAHALSRSGEGEDAVLQWTEAAEIFASLSRTEEMAEAQLNLGNHHFRSQHYDKAESCYAAAAAGLRREENPRLFAMILNAQAGLLLQSHQDPGQALPMLRDAADLRRRIGSRRGEATSLHNIAFSHQLLGEFEQARAINEKVLDMRRLMQDAIRTAETLHNDAQVLLALGRIEESLAEAQESLAMKRRLQDTKGHLADCLNLVGTIELELGRTERAREAFAEVLREHADEPDEAFKAEEGMATVDWLAGRHDAAQARFTALVARGEQTPGWESRSQELTALSVALRFGRERGATAPSILAAAERALSVPDGPWLPEVRFHRAWIGALTRAASGSGAVARDDLIAALDIAERLGALEWIWRVRRDIALLESEGAPARRAAILEAARLVAAQAGRFRQAELRMAYLGHPERAALARMPEAAAGSNDAPTKAL